MKKILTLVVLLGFGFMVGCGDDKPPAKSGSTSAGPSGTTVHSTSTPTGTK
jgi:hypothetical protein